MKAFSLLFLLLPCTVAVAQPSLPATPQRPVTDTYFGQAVVDPYRWLEDLNSPEVQVWLKAQGAYTADVLARLPGRDQLIKTFEDYDQLQAVRYGEVVKRGTRYYYRKTLAGESVGKLYLREGLRGPEQLLFDPVAYDPAHTCAVTAFALSPDGEQVVIALQQSGDELATLRTLRVAARTFWPESIPAVNGGVVAWLPDGRGFLYTPQNSADFKDPASTLNTQAHLHRLDTAPGTDPVVLSRAHDPALGIRPDQYPLLSFSDDHTQLYGELYSVDQRRDIWLAAPADLGKPRIQWQRLVAPTDSVYNFRQLGAKLYLFSVKGAPNGCIRVTDAAHPNPATAAVLLPEGPLKIARLRATRDYLFVVLNDGINDHIRQYDPRTNQWADVPLPLAGTAVVLPLDAAHGNDALTGVTSWKQPLTFYDYQPANKLLTTSAFNSPTAYPGMADLVVEELEVPSHDGVRVPLSLIYRKGLKRDGQAVCLMTGYGAYGYSALPYFEPTHLALLNQGVIVAVTHPRGGSEKGNKWYRGGFQTTKPNTWKDFIACGEYLVKNKYTSPAHLIGKGESAGGILIGQAITERPDLFAAAISNVSESNALRGEIDPNGPANVPEFGTVQDSVQCRALYEMDAVQHVRPGTRYPAVICVGGMNDSRVIVWQPGKFAAALQNASTSSKPVLLQVNYDNGHFTEDKKVTFRDFANMYAFALWQAGHPSFQPGVARAKP